MFLQLFDRLISLGVISGLVAWWLTIDISSKHTMGKDAYVAYSSAYFDRYYLRPFHPVTSAIGYFFFITAFYAIYEGIAFFIRRIGGSQPPKEG